MITVPPQNIQNKISKIFGGVPPKQINMITELYSGTGSAVRCGDAISDLFLVITRVIRGVYWPPHFSALAWTGFWGECQRSSCGASFGNVKISDLDFTDDAVIFAETPFGGPRGAE